MREVLAVVIGISLAVLYSNFLQGLPAYLQRRYEKSRFKKRTKWSEFKHRFNIAIYLIFQSKHGFIIRINEKQVEQLEKHNQVGGSVDMTVFGINHHNGKFLIKQLGNSMTDIDLILDKASFEAEVDEFIEKQKDNEK